MDEYENDVVVSQAPCITLNMKETSTENGTAKLNCDVSLLPIEISFRQRTLSNLSAFANSLKERNNAMNEHHHRTSSSRRSKSKSSVEKPRESSSSKEITFCCLCPSIAFTLPLVREVSTDPLFERSREILNGHPVRGAYFGIIFDNNAIEFNEKGATSSDSPTSDSSDSGAKFSCHYMSFFASSPVGDRVAVDSVMRRTDILVGKGRLEVNPYTSISIEYKPSTPGTKERNHCKESFPIIPTISSFKARQEDDDEDNKIDRMLTSKLHDVDAHSRKELRGTDPQLEMISEVEKCGSAVIVNIPILVADLTRTEMETLLLMLGAVSPDDSASGKNNNNKTSTTTEKEPNDTSSPGLCFGINIDQISLSLREDATTCAVTS